MPALLACQREALSSASFGDARVLLEKYLPAPRHIEVQVFVMRSGMVAISCICTSATARTQRRHQKK